MWRRNGVGSDPNVGPTSAPESKFLSAARLPSAALLRYLPMSQTGHAAPAGGQIPDEHGLDVVLHEDPQALEAEWDALTRHLEGFPQQACEQRRLFHGSALCGRTAELSDTRAS